MAKGKRREAPREKPGAEPEPEGLPRAFPPPAAAAIVFIAAGAVLMLEILAVRLLAPYVGLTLEATTSIIGAALGGIALGAAVGGYFADRTNTRLLIVGLLLGGGLLTLLTVPVVRWLGPGAQGKGDIAALGITVAALVPAASVLSAVSPSVAHLQLHDLRASGTIVGRLSAWATAGALLGTFGTGFVVMPLMPASTAVLLIGLGLLLVGIAVSLSSSLFSPASVILVAIVAVGVGALTALGHSPCLRETKYHCISLEPVGPRGYELKLDRAYNSYVDLDDPTHLRYAYTRWIADSIDSTYPGGEPLDVVFVGGGAFTLPRWLLATRPGSTAETLELDDEVVDFDRERLGLRTSPRMQVLIGDARMTIRGIPSDSADVIVGDAFSGETVPWHLTTREWMEEVERVLKPGGLYAENLIDLPPLEFFRAEATTMLDTFADVRLINGLDANGELVGGNLVLIASDRPLPGRAGSGAENATTFRRPEVRSFAAGGEDLRDDFAPVDQIRNLG